MTARISLIPGKARGHRLRLRAVALALRGPRLQLSEMIHFEQKNWGAESPPIPKLNFYWFKDSKLPAPVPLRDCVAGGGNTSTLAVNE
jgi:hypothetical protein